MAGEDNRSPALVGFVVTTIFLCLVCSTFFLGVKIYSMRQEKKKGYFLLVDRLTVLSFFWGDMDHLVTFIVLLNPGGYVWCNFALRAAFISYQYGRSFLYALLVYRLACIYDKSAYRYSRGIIHGVPAGVAFLSVGFTILAAFVLRADRHCVINVPLQIYVGVTVDLVLIVLLTHLFVRPLRQLTNSMATLSTRDVHHRNESGVKSISSENETTTTVGTSMDATALSVTATQATADTYTASNSNDEASGDKTSDNADDNAQEDATKSPRTKKKKKRKDTLTRAQKLQKLAFKTTMLACIAFSSTFVGTIMAALFRMPTFMNIDICVYQACVLFMEKRWDDYYHKICCGPIACAEKCREDSKTPSIPL